MEIQDLIGHAGRFPHPAALLIADALRDLDDMGALARGLTKKR